ncbi:MAG TPA: hypothetical protein VI999_02505 [Thermoplasmata archaeon]|nr:hypothetical protein [Thermoplasmata archaeon]
MDPEFAKRDARAVEDPIAAVFDLAESVDRQTPKIRRMLRYVRVFVSLWLLLDFFLIIVSAAISGGRPGETLFLFLPIVGLLLAMRYAAQPSTRLALFIVVVVFGVFQVLLIGGLVFLGAVLVSLFILGFVILELMRDLRSFFDYFALRHRVISAVRAADPVVHVPQGKDAAARILAHLAATSPDVRAMMALPGAVAAPAILTGRSGLAYSLDAYVRSEPTQLTRIVGIGHPGFAVFVKAFDRAPTAADLQSVKAAVEDVSLATRIPPARILAVWRAHGDESVAADAYAFLNSEAARVTIRGSTYACSLELAREGDDGTYDFIPVVVDAHGSIRPGTPARSG